MSSETGTGVEVTVQWTAFDDVPVLSANQFLFQMSGAAGSQGPDEIILSIGHMAPPTVVGTPEEQARAVVEAGAVNVNPIARISLTRRRLGELTDLLNQSIARYDEAGGTG